MGHVRLGRLPKTPRWIEVINLLDTAAPDPAGLAAAVVRAAEFRLRQLANDEGMSRRTRYGGCCGSMASTSSAGGVGV